jgi:dienelactone hydrolase
MRRLLPLLLLVPAARAADPPPPPGLPLAEAYFRSQAKQIADACLTDLTTKEDWEKRRPELRRQFLDMIGLWPLPPRTDLKAVTTGTFDAGKFTVENVHFQSLPGLYVTGNLYLPKPAPTKAPAVLYVCGHSNLVKDGVSYGSKMTYERHPSWFAEHGYVCLIVDTLELGEVRGEHHGTYSKGRWWWQSVGYTPAGVECWNAMRALDYLETRPEVDKDRLGVTGRSGGGATSWWLAAADDRPKCIIPVAGIADLQAQIVEGVAPRYKNGGVISGHCDCMFMVNTYRWDFPMVAALCAPRPLLLGNSDADDIFPVPGYRRLADKVRKVYDLYGAGEKFQLMETKGPHQDTPELRLGAFRWMIRWLKNDPSPVTETDPPELPPARLKVFDRIPADEVNTRIDELLVKPAPIPEFPGPDQGGPWWRWQCVKWVQAVRDQVFRGWPANPPELDVKPAADVTADGLRLRAFDFVSEEAVPLRLWLMTAAGVDKPKLTVLTAVDEAG